MGTASRSLALRRRAMQLRRDGGAVGNGAGHQDLVRARTRRAVQVASLSLPVVASVQVTATVFHPSGSVLVCGCNHGLLRLYSVGTGKLLQVRVCACVRVWLGYAGTQAKRWCGWHRRWRPGRMFMF